MTLKDANKTNRLGAMRFNKQWPEIERMLSEKYPKSFIYEELSGRLEMSYRQFLRHVANRSKQKPVTRPAVSLPLPQPKRKLTEDEDHGRREFRERVEGIKMPDAWREELSKLGTRR